MELNFFRKKRKVREANNNATNPDLELIYRDAERNRYYKWKDDKHMPSERYLIGMVKVEEANMGVDSQDLVLHLDEALKYFNASNFAESAVILTKLRNRVVTADPTNAYLSLATVYILLNDELPKKYDLVTAKRKMILFRQSVEVKSFFLDFAFELIKNWQPTSKRTIQDVSKQQPTKQGSEKSMTPLVS